jgi:hypothetical protein
MLNFSWVPPSEQSVAANISLEAGLLFKAYDYKKKKVVTLKIPQDYPISPIPSDLYLRLHAPGFPSEGLEQQFDWTYSPPSTVPFPTPADYTGIALAWDVLTVTVPSKIYIITIKSLTSKQPCPLNVTASNTAEWSVKYLLSSYMLAKKRKNPIGEWIEGMKGVQTIPTFHKSFFEFCGDDPGRLKFATLLPPLSGLTDEIATLTEKMFGPGDQKLRRLTYGRLRKTKAELSKVDRLMKGLGRVPSAKRVELRDAAMDALERALIRKDETLDAISKLSVSRPLDPKSMAIQALAKLDMLRRS